MSLYKISFIVVTDINGTRTFSQQYQEKKNTQIKKKKKIHQVEAELFHADRRTVGHDEANSRI
jgi:hypothetical protein